MLRSWMTHVAVLVLAMAGLAGQRPVSAASGTNANAGAADQKRHREVTFSAGGDPCCLGRHEPLAHASRVLVRFKAGTARATRDKAHADAKSLQTLREYHAVSDLVLVGVREGDENKAIAAYRRDPNVLYAEPDYMVHTTAVPNDPDFGLLWGLHNTGQIIAGNPGTPGADIQALEAWDIWTGDPEFRIAVIDSGVDYHHPDLARNIWTNPGEIPNNGIDEDGNGYVDDFHGYDFYNEDGDPMDDHYLCHGSHVAGTIGGVAQNREGIAGVNWRCKIVGLKFIPGSG